MGFLSLYKDDDLYYTLVDFIEITKALELTIRFRRPGGYSSEEFWSVANGDAL